MEIAIRLLRCFTSACWRAGAGSAGGEPGWGSGTVPAGSVVSTVVAGGQHVPCSSRGLGCGWRQQSPHIACYSCGFNFLLCVRSLSVVRSGGLCCGWECGWSVTWRSLPGCWGLASMTKRSCQLVFLGVVPYIHTTVALV